MSTVRGLPAGVLGRRAPLWRGAPELPDWAWYGILVVIAVLMGVFAGINPKYAIAGAFGLAFVMLVLVDLTFGLCAFTFLSFLELLLVSEDRSFSFLKVAGFLLLLSWVATISTSREQDKSFIAAHPQFTFVLIAFFSWAALSSYWAEDPGRAYDTVVALPAEHDPVPDRLHGDPAAASTSSGSAGRGSGAPRSRRSRRF